MNDGYKEVPCKCGFIPEKNYHEFEIYEINMGKFMGKDIGKKRCLRCKTCKEISILKRSDISEIQQKDELTKIIDIITSSPIF